MPEMPCSRILTYPSNGTPATQDCGLFVVMSSIYAPSQEGVISGSCMTDRADDANVPQISSCSDGLTTQ